MSERRNEHALSDAAVRASLDLPADAPIPESLSIRLGNAASSPAPMQVWWGERLIVFENDASIVSRGGNTSIPQRPCAAHEFYGEGWAGVQPAVERLMHDAAGAVVHGIVMPHGAVRSLLSDTATLVLQPIVNTANHAIEGAEVMVVIEPRNPPATVADGSHGEVSLGAIGDLSFLLESIPDAFLTIDDEWRFTYISTRAAEVLGTSAAALLGRTPRDVYPALEGTAFEKVCRTAMTQRIGGSVSEYYAQHDRWYEVWCVPASLGLIVYFRDVSFQKEADAALRASAADKDAQQRIYEAILRNTPDLSYVFDLDHRFKYANDVLLRTLGRTREEAIGHSCLELGCAQMVADTYDRAIDEIAHTGAVVRGQVPFEGPAGTRIHDYILVPVVDADEHVVAVAGTTRDVTEMHDNAEELRQLAARLSEADRRKGEFLAVLAHELRNPLAPLLNGLQIIQRVESDKAMRLSTASMMQRQLTHMVRLVDDLLDVNRITRGTIQLTREDIPLAALLDLSAEAVAPVLRAADQRLEMSRPSSAVILDADRVRLVQVFTNLIVNASKFSPRGGVIEISAAVDDAAVKVTVRDHGVGIPVDMLSSVFDLFTQVERARSREHGGLGIGLTLARSVVELHGGSVEAFSEGTGTGSEFVVTLPLSPRARPVDEGEGRSQSAPGSRRVLVVDDNRDSAISLSVLLSLTGNETTTAFDGEEALTVASEFDPDLILLDIGLPKLNGYEVCRRLRERPRSRPLYIVALTGWGQEEDRRKSVDAGFDAHLVKPMDPTALQRTLEQFSKSSPT